MNPIFKRIRSGSKASQLAERLQAAQASAQGSTFSTVGAMAQAGLSLRQTCATCEAERLFKAEDLVETFGADTPLSEANPDCADCGSKSVSMLPV